MPRVLNRLEPYFFVVLRVVAGVLFAFHGVQKLFGLAGGQRVPLIGQFGLAGIIEFAGGIIIALGIPTVTPIVALIAALEMITAYTIAHAPRGLVPIQNGGELALLYCATFLFVAMRSK